MHNIIGFYNWVLKEAVGQPDGNPITDLALIIIKPDSRTDYTQARTLEQWQALLPPEWHGEVNVLFRLYQGCPFNELDYLV